MDCVFLLFDTLIDSLKHTDSTDQLQAAYNSI